VASTLYPLDFHLHRRLPDEAGLRPASTYCAMQYHYAAMQQVH
jgi:hypothetical protein